MVGPAAPEVREEAVTEGFERRGALGHRDRAEIVDDVVGIPAEPVEGVDVAAFAPGQQPGRPVVGGAVTAMEGPAGGVAAVEDGGHPLLTTASTRSAASRPESRTMGTPTPGTVPDPVNTSPGAAGCTLAGRNGPDWRKRWASANGVPRSIPACSQSSGSTNASASTSAGEAG